MLAEPLISPCCCCRPYYSPLRRDEPCGDSGPEGWERPDDVAAGAADNEIGAEGAKALADALAPREGSDSNWHCNEALTTLNLNGAATCSPNPSPPLAAAAGPTAPL